MRGRRILRVLKVVAIVIVAFTLFGFVVTNLWNYLMPGLFGLRRCGGPRTPAPEPNRGPVA